MAADYAVLAVHRHAGEIAHVLVGTGQLVEQGGFAAVLVACQGKGQRCALGQRRPGLAGMVTLGLAQFTHAGVRHRGVALFTAGGTVTAVHVLHRDAGGVVQPQGQLVPAQLHLDGVPHGGYLAQGDLGAGGQAHIQQVVPQFAGAANGLDHGVLADLQFCQCHNLCFLPSAVQTESYRIKKSLARLTGNVNAVFPPKYSNAAHGARR